LATAGGRALAVLARGEVVPRLALAVAKLTPKVAGGRISVLAKGGRVWAESLRDEGSSLFLELPLWTGAG
jgi:hypothetical protein